MKQIISKVICSLLLGLGIIGCAGHNLLGQVVDDNLYVNGVAQPKGPVAIGRNYAFRFVEKWRISHAWIQGTGVRPCLYPSNVFRSVEGYPQLAAELEGPLLEYGNKIYYGTTLYSQPQGQIYLADLRHQTIEETPRGFQSTGYKPFCGQFLTQTRNGIGLWIVRPDPAKGTDAWIEGAIPVQLNGLTWLVKLIPPQDLGPTGEMAKPIERWTLKIPDTPYWLHMSFSASLNYSVRLQTDAHYFMLNLFHQLIESVKLEPITAVPTAALPPFRLPPPNPDLKTLR